MQNQRRMYGGRSNEGTMSKREPLQKPIESPHQAWERVRRWYYNHNFTNAATAMGEIQMHWQDPWRLLARLEQQGRT